jgi:hypothetical protein
VKLSLGHVGKLEPRLVAAGSASGDRGRGRAQRTRIVPDRQKDTHVS